MKTFSVLAALLSYPTDELVAAAFGGDTALRGEGFAATVQSDLVDLIAGDRRLGTGVIDGEMCLQLAAGGHMDVLWQPFEFLIIGGAAIGQFIIGNPKKVIGGAAGSFADGRGGSGQLGEHRHVVGRLRTVAFHPVRRGRDQTLGHVGRQQDVVDAQPAIARPRPGLVVPERVGGPVRMRRAHRVGQPGPHHPPQPRPRFALVEASLADPLREQGRAVAQGGRPVGRWRPVAEQRREPCDLRGRGRGSLEVAPGVKLIDTPNFP